MKPNCNNLPEFVMVVGLPGSGKSTLIAKDYSDYCTHSSDAIREELTGDANNQDVNKKVFEILHTRVKTDLSAGKNVVYDATNISWKRRKAFLQELSNITCYRKCLLVATPFEECLKRNNARDRVVPALVIERMYRNFDIPWYNEGWDNIQLVYTEDFTSSYGDWKHFLEVYSDFDQENKWHTETLGSHCLKAFNYVQDHVSELISENERETVIAAALHDCGKPFVKTFKDSKGSDSEFAHYYGHENVGAYASLFYGKDEGIDNLFVAALIRYHMILHFFKDWQTKTIAKYEKEFNTSEYLKTVKFYEALKVLHAGDKAAH